MSAANRMSQVTLDALKTAPAQFQNLISNTAAGTNPAVTFAFTELKIPRGTIPHPPNTDREEVRSSVTVQFNGTSQGSIMAHLFNDGTIKTSTQMHQEVNARRQYAQLLKTEEDKFPELQQTAARQQAHTRMMQRIATARTGQTSIMQKQLEKSSAQQEYQLFLQGQAQVRQQQAVIRAQAQAGRGRGR